MRLEEAPLPARPVKVYPPGTSFRAQVVSLLIACAVVAGTLAVLTPVVRDLAADFGLRNRAQRVTWAGVERGSCSYRLVFARCDVDLLAHPPGQAEVRQHVAYMFFGTGLGELRMEALAHPARPDRLTTDFGLERLSNRTAMIAVMGPLLLLIAVALGLAPILKAPSKYRENRRIRQLLSAGRLRAVALQLVKLDRDSWTVAPRSGTRGEERTWPSRGFPVVLDPQAGVVLGVTTGDGLVAIPLDVRLSFLGLTGEERGRLMAWIGPERVAWRPPGYAESTRRRERRRAAAFWMAVIGVASGAAAGLLGYLSVRDPAAGSYVTVDLDAGGVVRSGNVELRGFLQHRLAVQVVLNEPQGTFIDEYRPMTRTGWTKSEPIEWLVKEYSPGSSEPQASIRRGQAAAVPLPPSVLATMKSRLLTLSPRLMVLEVRQRDGSWDWPIAILAVLAFGLLMPAGILYLTTT
jgi:hypothetical protein